MTDKERLVELMKKGYEAVPIGGFVYEGIADHLLKNGVIVAPMPMAEWLRQELTEHIYKRCMEEL